MYINKKSKKRMKKPYYSFIPAICLSLFLVFTVAILTGMCSMFPKVTAIVYDGGNVVGELNLTWERNKSDVKLYRSYVRRILEDNHLKSLDDLDVIELDESNENIRFTIKRAFNIKCKIFGEEKILKASPGETVKSLLERNGIEEEDGIFSSPPMESVVRKRKKHKNKVRIIVDKFEKKIVEEKEEVVPFTVKEEQDSSLKDNERKLKQKGENGVKKVFRINGYMNGELKEEITKEEVIKPVVDEIYLVKKPSPQKVEKPAQLAQPPLPQSPVEKKEKDKKEKAEKPKKQSKSDASNKATAPPVKVPIGKAARVLQGIATAYVAKGNTSRMGRARYGVVAVNPDDIPYGTRMYITGYGECVAGDLCGAARKRKVLVDLCFNTEAECRAFGRRRVTIYILDGPGASNVNAASVSENVPNSAPKNNVPKKKRSNNKASKNNAPAKNVRSAIKGKSKSKVKT